MAASDKSDADNKTEQAAAAQAKADEAAKKAAEGEKSPEQKKADALAAKADDAKAEAQDANTAAASSDEATTAAELKADSAVTDPDRKIGDHHAQRFSNTPENPPLAQHLDPEAEIPDADKVKLVMTTSDTIAAGKDAVCYVHKDMKGDYLRAGWREADAP